MERFFEKYSRQIDSYMRGYLAYAKIYTRAYILSIFILGTLTIWLAHEGKNDSIELLEYVKDYYWQLLIFSLFVVLILNLFIMLVRFDSIRQITIAKIIGCTLAICQIMIDVKDGIDIYHFGVVAVIALAYEGIRAAYSKSNIEL